MGSIKVWLKTAKWVLWVVAAIGVAILGAMFRGLFSSPGDSTPAVDPFQPPAKLKEKAQKAQEEALVAKVESTAKSDAAVKELKEVGKLSDAAERRRRLAELVRKQAKG